MKIKRERLMINPHSLKILLGMRLWMKVKPINPQSMKTMLGMWYWMKRLVINPHRLKESSTMKLGMMIK